MGKITNIPLDEREAKARKFDRAAAEYRAAAAAARTVQGDAKIGEERRAAMRAEYYADFKAKEAARQAALLRETEQQRQEREDLKGLANELRRTCPHCRRGREILPSERNNRLIKTALALKM